MLGARISLAISRRPALDWSVALRGNTTLLLLFGFFLDLVAELGYVLTQSFHRITACQQRQPCHVFHRRRLLLVEIKHVDRIVSVDTRRRIPRRVCYRLKQPITGLQSAPPPRNSGNRPQIRASLAFPADALVQSLNRHFAANGFNLHAQWRVPYSG